MCQSALEALQIDEASGTLNVALEVSYIRSPDDLNAAFDGSVDGVPLSGPNGHLNGVFAVGQASDRTTAFLAR